MNTLILNFWHPEPCKNNILLFSAIQFMVICYGNPRKQIHPILNGPENYCGNVVEEIYLLIQFPLISVSCKGIQLVELNH